LLLFSARPLGEGLVPVNGKSPQGKALYAKAKQLYAKAKQPKAKE